MTAELSLWPTGLGDGDRLPLAMPLNDVRGSWRFGVFPLDCDRVVGRRAGEDVEDAVGDRVEGCFSMLSGVEPNKLRNDIDDGCVAR